jgi:protein tyrosine phosphatase
MAHVAELNETNVVIRVIVVHNDYEPHVEEWAADWAGGGIWKQTSYNGNMRKNFAGIGYTYDEQRDAFISPKCHDEATLIEDLCRWECANDEHKAPTI